MADLIKVATNILPLLPMTERRVLWQGLRPKDDGKA